MSTSTARAAVGAGTAILLGYFSIAIAFGASGRAIGLSPLAVAGFSVFVFAGASQFMAVSLLAQGAGVFSVVAAALVLNSRHVVMSMSLSERIAGNRVPRALLAFGVTDEVFAASATGVGAIRDTHLLLMEGLAYSGWVGGTIVGFLIGSILPQAIEEAMGIALYAMFVALIVPAVVRFPRYLLPALTAGAANWVLQMAGMPVGLALLLAIAAVAVAFSVTPSWSEQ